MREIPIQKWGGNATSRVTELSADFCLIFSMQSMYFRLCIIQYCDNLRGKPVLSFDKIKTKYISQHGACTNVKQQHFWPIKGHALCYYGYQIYAHLAKFWSDILIKGMFGSVDKYVSLELGRLFEWNTRLKHFVFALSCIRRRQLNKVTKR